MPTTKQDLLDLVDTLVAKHEALTAAHDSTTASEQNVANVTVVEQAKIDEATSHYDQETTNARQFAAAAHVAEDTATAEDAQALNALVAAINSFDAGA
jgi:nucleoid-associated protein YgaU